MPVQFAIVICNPAWRAQVTSKTRSLLLCTSLLILLFRPVSILRAADAGVADSAKRKDAEGVRALLKQHADVNAKQGDGATALMWAAHWNDLQMAEDLIAA